MCVCTRCLCIAGRFAQLARCYVIRHVDVYIQYVDIEEKIEVRPQPFRNTVKTTERKYRNTVQYIHLRYEYTAL